MMNPNPDRENLKELLLLKIAGFLSEEEDRALDHRISTEPEVARLWEDIQQIDALNENTGYFSPESRIKGWNEIQKALKAEKRHKALHYVWIIICLIITLLVIYVYIFKNL
ncbi:hypothetical protein [Chitinophaga sp. Cy-1792]|uniref:hypothetical protein n=1 Tax=Chitinophaga sp. Cy-1792 TaxID=2608339 RepID=UPI001423D0F2|nr:hypothetical protein [Chitinophaga sp. Cy-1792]NIG56655.1 hypothetical protein [Chitinophaga sp. Cy-1792]